MPLDPSLSLQAQPVQTQPLDLTKTLLSVAQLRNLMSEADLRQLQTAQLGETMREYQGITAAGGPLEQLRGTYASEQAPAPPLWRTPPQTTSAAVQVPPPAMIGASPSLYSQLSPQGQQEYAANRPTPQQALTQPLTERLSTAPQPAAGASMDPQATPQPSQMPSVGTGEQSTKRAEILRNMTLQYPRVGPHIVKPFMEVDTQILANKKAGLELQDKLFDGIAQMMDAVRAQPADQQAAAYAEGYAALKQHYGPQAVQGLSPTFQSAQVALYATRARDAKTRAEQHLALMGKENEAWKNAIDQAKLGKVTAQQTASGNWITIPENPGANTGPLGGGGTGGTSAPLVNPLTGQPYTSMEAEKFKDEQQGTITSQHQTASQPFREATLAMSMIRQSAHPTDPKAGQVSDQALADNYFKLMMPSNLRNAPDSQVRDLARRGNLGEQASRLWERLFGPGGAPLEQDDRDRILAHAETLYKQQGEDYDKNVRGPALARLQALPGGPTVPAEQLIPDARTTAPGPATAARLSPAEHTQLIEQTGTRLGISPETIALYKAITFAGERSNGDPLARNVGAGGVVATGLGQITADTAKPYGYSAKDLEHPGLNTEAGLKIVQALMQKYPGRPDLVAAEYNAGPKPVQDAGTAVPNYPKTQEYVQRTLAHLKSQQQAASPAQTTPAAAQAPTDSSPPQDVAAYQRWREARIQALQAERQRLTAGGGR